MTQLTILDRAKKVFKNNKKYAAMACAGVIVGSLAAVSIPSVSYANAISSSSSSFNEWSAMTSDNSWDMSSEEYTAYEKEQFQKDYGTEDKFQTTYENDRIKEEINGATGVIRTTDKKTGEVSDWDFFKALDEELAEESEFANEYFAENGQL